MIRLENLSKTYTRKKANGQKVHFKALDQISYQLNHGKIYSIVGESGSGKTTLAKVITGLESHDEGTIRYKNFEVKNKYFFNKKDIRRNIQLVQQDTYSALNPKMSIYNCILEPIRNLCPIHNSKEVKRVEELLGLVELDTSVMYKKPGQLSGGQQKRVNIARAISSNPELIIFDEATSGLDVVVKKRILDLLKKIQRERACSFLFITHDIEVAMYMSDYISVMEKGKIVEQVAYENCLSCFKHAYSKALIESTF